MFSFSYPQCMYKTDDICKLIHLSNPAADVLIEVHRPTCKYWINVQTRKGMDQAISFEGGGVEEHTGKVFFSR